MQKCFHVLYFASLLMRPNVMAKQNNFLELLQDPQRDFYYKGSIRPYDCGYACAI